MLKAGAHVGPLGQNGRGLPLLAPRERSSVVPSNDVSELRWDKSYLFNEGKSEGDIGVLVCVLEGWSAWSTLPPTSRASSSEESNSILDADRRRASSDSFRGFAW